VLIDSAQAPFLVSDPVILLDARVVNLVTFSTAEDSESSAFRQILSSDFCGTFWKTLAVNVRLKLPGSHTSENAASGLAAPEGGY
jgi:hypothetical protein